FDPVDRANTAKLFGEFFTRIHAELLYPLKANLVDSEDHRPDPAVIELPAANFIYRGRAVAVKALKMAATEVTIAEFASFINDKLGRGDYQVEKELRQVVDTAGNLVCHFDAHHPGDMLNYEKGIFTAVPNRQYYPMTHVSWHAAVSYADYVGGRLPTETEWVRAAGFWDDSLHIYASNSNDYDRLVQQINFDGSTDPNDQKRYPQTLPAGFLTANGNGMHEMSGNVWEWCSDWFNSRTYRNLAKDETHVDPQGPETGTMRTFKGGSWGAGLDVTKVSYRVALAPELALADLGFRVVWDE
ncbi:MAG: SUMF1/EgtB/PvdO family nonheme iron enzyme, partial [Candidatus Marinimicrobia bacterium]|nr:SUMF1/EgtB/PvdO family nonheme iron enzyme [Candidatus Neomarinimicrobiota bacterium]